MFCLWVISVYSDFVMCALDFVLTDGFPASLRCVLWLMGLIWRFSVGFGLGDLVLFAAFWVLVLVLFVVGVGLV